jgi:hypothetical protein
MSEEAAANKFPIILAYGLGGFDEFKIFGITIQYFKGIKRHLEDCGYTVFVTKVKPIEKGTRMLFLTLHNANLCRKERRKERKKEREKGTALFKCI